MTQQAQAEALKPCPFCGGEAKMVKSGEQGTWRVNCWNDDCDVTTPNCSEKALAISVWNLRAPAQLEAQQAAQPWGACISGRIWVGKLPEHARKMAEAEGLPILWLYTSPPAQERKPLTNEQIDALWGGENVSAPQLVNRRAISRSIERAHGIKEPS